MFARRRGVTCSNECALDILVIWSQFANRDRHPRSVIQLRVDADIVSPLAAAEQYHLPDARGNSNRHPANTSGAAE